MNALEILAICVSTVVGVLGVATIFAGAWVKASHLEDLQGEIDKVQAEVDKLWDRFTVVTVLETKIAAIEDGIHEIKELLKR
jgi:hypothetical protein